MQTQTRDSSSASGLCVSAATALPRSGRARGSYLPAPAPDCEQALLKEPGKGQKELSTSGSEV